MPKNIQENEEIYLAPGILGKYENGTPIATDERNGDTLNPEKIDDKITIYKREVKEWFLDPASTLIIQDSFTNAFVVLMICMAYIEGVEQYKTGKRSNGRSRECFIASLKRLYSDQFQEDELEVLYKKSRCGLFHNGMVKGGVVFDYDSETVFKFQSKERVEINPRLLLKDIKEDFRRYINDLKKTESNQDLRSKFDRHFSVC